MSRDYLGANSDVDIQLAGKGTIEITFGEDAGAGDADIDAFVDRARSLAEVAAVFREDREFVLVTIAEGQAGADAVAAIREVLARC